MFGMAERRARDLQLQLVHESRLMLDQRLAACARGRDETARAAFEQMRDEIEICGQVLETVGVLAPNELEVLDRIHRGLLADVPRGQSLREWAKAIGVTTAY
jgi:hypothetical protein